MRKRGAQEGRAGRKRKPHTLALAIHTAKEWKMQIENTEREKAKQNSKNDLTIYYCAFLS